MAQKTFMGFIYDDQKAACGGTKDGGYDVDFGFGMNNPAPISLVEEIYRLEYLTSQVAVRIKRWKQMGREIPMRTEVRLNDLKSSLERSLDAENARIAFAMHLRSRHATDWVNSQFEKRQRDLALVGDIDTLTTEAIKTGRLPNGKHIPSSIFLGAVLPNGKKVAAVHIKHLDAAGFGNVWGWVNRMVPAEADKRIRDYIDDAYRAPKYDAMMQSFVDAIARVQAASSLDEKIVAFHVTLSVAHCSSFIVNNLYGQGTVEKLNKLSTAHDPRWDVELDAIIRS